MVGTIYQEHDHPMTHYQVLGVEAHASRHEVKQAFVALALEHHPDRHSSSFSTETSSAAEANSLTTNQLTVSFQRIQAAWDCLQNSDDRKQYDQSLYIEQQQLAAKRQSAIRIEIGDCYTQENCDNDYYYKCRCGQELNVHDEVDDLLECTACSLVYDTSAVFQD